MLTDCGPHAPDERRHRPLRGQRPVCRRRAGSRSSVVGRYYDPGTGQFLSVDPLVDVTGQPYSYTGGNPVNAKDPTGADIIKTIPASAAIALGRALEFGGGAGAIEEVAGFGGVAGDILAVALETFGASGADLVSTGEEALVLARRTGRHGPQRGVVTIDFQTISIFGFDTKILTGLVTYIADTRRVGSPGRRAHLTSANCTDSGVGSWIS